MIWLTIANTKLFNGIFAKIISKTFKKYLALKSAKVAINDLRIIDASDKDKVLVHISCDVEVSKEELLTMIDSKLDLLPE